MAAITKNLVIDQGTDFSHQFTAYEVNFVQDGSLSLPVTISSYTLQSQLKTSYTTSSSGVSFGCEIISPEEGTFKIMLTDLQTVELEARRYVYDVIATNTSTGLKYKLYEGIATVVPTVTK